MKIAAATLALMLASTSANAWDAKTGGSGPQAIGQDGGSATAQQQHQTATARSAARATSSSRSAGGAATGGIANAQAGSSNVSISGLGSGGGSSSGGGRAPDVYIPSVGASGADCPTVGFGAGGSGLGGGGGFGPSWISSKCDTRKTVDLLANVFGPAVARAYAVQNIEGVKEAVASATQGRTVQNGVLYEHPAWCIDSTGRWLRDLGECGEDPR